MARPTIGSIDLAYYFNGLQHRRQRARTERWARGSSTGEAAYAPLHPQSLSLIDVRPREGRAPSVNLVVIDIGPSLLFAGLNTAIISAARVAEVLHRPLRIVVLSVRRGKRAVGQVDDLLTRKFPDLGPIRLVYQSELANEVFSDRDVWMPTFWTTAHALDVLCRAGRILPDQVLYLVQDYEPSFFPFSTDSALARSTYHAGFRMMVNSSPLATFLRDAESINLPDSNVFAPELDLDLLARAAARRRPSPTIRILFYGRPSKPRNMFSLGTTALALAMRQLDGNGAQVEVLSAGEAHDPVSLGPAHVLRPLGRLGWSDYFERLSVTDVVVALQASPHPSHPPLDAVVSGAAAVTNDVGGTRTSLHERLLATRDSPTELADGIVRAVEAAAERSPGQFRPELLDLLGRRLEAVILHAVQDFA